MAPWGANDQKSHSSILGACRLMLPEHPCAVTLDKEGYCSAHKFFSCTGGTARRWCLVAISALPCPLHRPDINRNGVGRWDLQTHMLQFCGVLKGESSVAAARIICWPSSFCQSYSDSLTRARCWAQRKCRIKLVRHPVPFFSPKEPCWFSGPLEILQCTESCWMSCDDQGSLPAVLQGSHRVP